MMDVTKKLCLSALMLLFFCGVSTDATPKKELKEWMKKIAMHKMKTSCWGEKTMMKMYHMVEEVCEECMQLDPAFDINIFEDAGDMDDNDFNPFIQSNQGFQTLPAQAPQGFFIRNPVLGSQFNKPKNPMEAWLAFMAPYYGQQYAYSRTRRAADPPTQEELQEFAEHVSEFKMEKMSNMGNLTCVLRKLDVLDNNLNINLDHFTKDVWNKIERDERPAPEFRSRMIKGYQMCYQVADKIPMETLAKKGPFYKQFGKQMLFFKCAKMMEAENCVKKELLQWKEYLYGESTEEMQQALGLPKDKYDAAFMAFTVKDHAKPASMKFVHEFIFGKPGM